MTEKQKKSIRMSFPEDNFNKRQFPYFGDAFHKLHNLPGEYVHNMATELQKPGGEKVICDVVYLAVLPDGSKFIVNVEDESSKVKLEELKKSYGYKTLLICRHWLPVLTLITTTVPLDKCSKRFHYSETDLFSPRIDSFPDDDAWDNINRMIDKVKDKKVFTKSECLYFITLPRCCKHNQAEAVEKICEILLDIKVEEYFTKIELAYCMECLIHKYAKSEEDILRLQEMIGLDELKVERRTIFDEFKLEGIKEGKAKGKLEGIKEGKAKGKLEGIKEGSLAVLNSFANDPECPYTIEQLAKKFGFTVDEISKGK